MSVDIAELCKKLPLEEKLRVVEELWANLGESATPVALEPAQVEAAKRRAEDLAADPSLAIDRAELWRRVEAPDG